MRHPTRFRYAAVAVMVHFIRPQDQ